ncbi:hypothetical protein AO258_26335 [Pseudomonas syringae ICMP 19498]|nr:hypothetical protein AO258_26335 [Pseudomonas syringae ICMP 19498]
MLDFLSADKVDRNYRGLFQIFDTRHDYLLFGLTWIKIVVMIFCLVRPARVRTLNYATFGAIISTGRINGILSIIFF